MKSQSYMGLVILFWLVVMGIALQVAKAVLVIIGTILIVVVSMMVLVVAISGISKFINDLYRGECAWVNCILPAFIVCIAVIFLWPKLLPFFQAGLWFQPEISYIKLIPFAVVTIPMLFGFGYAFTGLRNLFRA